MRGIGIIILTVVFCISAFGVTSFAQDKAKEEKAPPAVTAGKIAPPAGAQTLARPPMPAARGNFAIVFGSLTKIDNSDPAKPKLEVKSDKDNTTHVIEMTPATNVTKLTDISELKTGDTVRVMVRKIEDKEVAMNVMTGKVRNIPAAPRPVAQKAATPAAAKPAEQ